MRFVQFFAFIFFTLCVLVGLMIIQTLYLQTEDEHSEHGGILKTLQYYLFLPRTKLQMAIRKWRSGYQEGGLSDNSVQLSDILSDLVTQTEYVQYLVFVISAPYKRDIRDLIRQEGYQGYNWTDEEGKPIQWKAFFVVGHNEDDAVNAAVRAEAAQHDDLLIGGFEDSYKNLVFKTLWLMEWAVNRYDFDAMIKCDDDTIVNMSKYHLLMQQQDLTVPFYGGARFGAMPVFRSGRYEVKKEEWFPDKFPPYCSGGGYTLNKLAIQKLLQTHYSHVQPVFLVEDAFIGVLAYHANVEVTSLVPYFRAFSPYKFCNKPESTLLHYVKNENQKYLMDNYKSYGLFCDDKFVEEHKKQ